MTRKRRNFFEVSDEKALLERFPWFGLHHYQLLDSEQIAQEVLTLRPIWRYVESTKYPDPLEENCPNEYSDWLDRLDKQSCTESETNDSAHNEWETVTDVTLRSLPGLASYYEQREQGVLVHPLTVATVRAFNDDLGNLPLPQNFEQSLMIDACPIDSLDTSWGKNYASLVIDLNDDPDEVLEDIQRLLKKYRNNAGIASIRNNSLTNQKSNRFDDKTIKDIRANMLLPYIDLYLNSTFSTINITDSLYARVLFPGGKKTYTNMRHLHRLASNLMLSDANPIWWTKLPHKAR